MKHTRFEGRKQQQQHAHHAPMATSRVHRIALSSLSFMLVVLLATLLGLTSAKKVFTGNKLRSQNKVYKLDPDTDLDICKAIVREMHTELIKHSLKEGGEDNIYETAGMAICLGVVQNYTFEADPAKKVWKLVRKAKGGEESDDLYAAFGAAGDADGQAQVVEGLLLTKKACMDFAEELQMEISEVMYARVHDATGDAIADDFCPDAVKPVKKEKVKYVPAASDKERAKSDPTALMSDFLSKRDTSGAITEMLEMEAAFPEKMLDPPIQAEVVRAAKELACQVCGIAVRQAQGKVKEVEKDVRFKDRWQRQSLVAEAVNLICHGKDYEKLKNGYYPQVPGNPPEWANDYYVLKKDAEYKLKKGQPSVAAMTDFVRQARSSSGASLQEEREEDWNKSRTKHEYDVTRLAIIRIACKAAIDQRLDTEDGDLSQLLLETRSRDAKAASKQYCQPLCAAQGSQEETRTEL